MKTSIEWLKEYSDINVSAKELCDILTMTGSKVEGLEIKGDNIKNVVVGKILEIEKHPNADKLVVTKVDVKDEILQIVTGATNIKVGDIVPIAKDGSELPGNIKIKKGKLRDIESCGMMCSVGELGIPVDMFENQIENGIMILPEKFEKNLGEDIVKVLDLKEEIIEFEITSNRPDCFSIEGLGRETAVSLNQDFKDPHSDLEKINSEVREEIHGLKVNIEAPDLCYRYIARVVENVKIAPSPEWMVKRLAACGVRSINNIVDITNYVMLELGQPMHAFDINSINGKHIIVRRAKENEKIITLDEVERNLDNDMLVIADEQKPVAIAGVMGGMNSEIEDNTKTVVFESAVFNGGNVRKTAKKLQLRTEASSRYEKGLSQENAERAVERAVQLVKMLNAGTEVSGKIDVYPTKQEKKKIKFDEKVINKLLGTNISKEEMINIFEKLGSKVENNEVIVPYFRMDIEQVADLAEEVARFYGYDKLCSTLTSGESTIGIKTKIQKISDDIEQMLRYKGLSEVCTYGFISKQDLKKVNLTEDDIEENDIIHIKNPLSEDYSIMRTTTIPSMMSVLATNNYKKNKEVKLFEIARIYKDPNNNISKGETPIEEKIITLGLYGENIDFYNMKGIVENILEVSNIARYECVSNCDSPSYHPGRVAKMVVGNDVIAMFGEINPIVTENYDISKRVYIAEISLEKLVKYSKDNKKYTEVAKFPAVERDIAVCVDNNIEVGQIEKTIIKKSKGILEDIKLFDIYKSEKLGLDKKSIAFSLIFRSKEKTLTDEEINKTLEEIILELKKVYNADLRK